MTAVLGVDLGGSSLRASVVGGDGRFLGTARVALPQRPGPGGRFEEDPERWWRALTDALRALGDALGAVRGIAISGFTRSQVFVDAAGVPQRPAILFGDSRAAALVKAALAQPGIAAHPGAVHLNAFHPLARLAWLARSEPEAWAATRYVIEPKDYLAARLTGRIVSDTVSQYWLARSFAAPPGHPPLAHRLGLGPTPCPQHLAPGDLIGHADASAGPLAGLPVFAGAPDSWAGVLGSGGMGVDRAYCISGTTEVTGLLCPDRADATGLLTLPWGGGLWQIGGPGQNGAATLDWAGAVLAPAAREAALARDAAPDAPFFLPFLKGERAPFWDPNLRAAFLGVGAGHGAEDLLRAAAEGVVFMCRRVLDRAETAAGARASRLYLSGGGARSRAFAQIRADALARPIVIPTEVETGVLGSAALALAGLGRAASPADAAATLLGQPSIIVPSAAGQERAEARFAKFNAYHEALAPLARRFAQEP